MTTVFLSWQLDRPPSEGKNFIEKALETAVKRVSRDLELDEPLRVDKDTQDVAGSPPIFDTIRDKIEHAGMVVSDLTFVSERPKGEPSPNPNVLIEYGYALKCLTCQRIIAVMNTAYGEPGRASLPFNLGLYRFPITFHLPKDASVEDRKTQRENLTKVFEDAVRSVLNSDAYKATLPKPVPPPPVKYREPLDGKARFRAKGELLGFTSGLRRRLFGGPDPAAFLDEGPAMWLRVAPTAPIQTPFEVGSLAEIVTPLFTLPFYEGGSNSLPVRSEDGYGFCAGLSPTKPCYSVVFVFTDGELWSIETFHLRTESYIPLKERKIAASLEQCAKFLNDNLKICGPYRFVIGIEGVRGRPIALPNDPMNRVRGACATDVIECEGAFDLSNDSAEALEPFFVQIFDKCGVKREKPARQR